MATWIICNLDDENVEETQQSNKVAEFKIWRNDKKEIRLEYYYGFGEWIYESDEKPKIELDNEDGFEVTTSNYEWEMMRLTNPLSSEWDFSDNVSPDEFKNFQKIWNENNYEHLEKLGWIEEPSVQYIFGPIRLRNAETNEEWLGS